MQQEIGRILLQILLLVVLLAISGYDSSPTVSVKPSDPNPPATHKPNMAQKVPHKNEIKT